MGNLCNQAPANEFEAEGISPEKVMEMRQSNLNLAGGKEELAKQYGLFTQERHR